MIKKLKKKFVILATVAVFILMTVLVGIMNVINYSSVVNEIDTIVSVISRPNLPFENQRRFIQSLRDLILRDMSPDVSYESNYFTALVSKSGTVVESDISRNISIDKDVADGYVQKAIESKHDRGFIGQFRFVRQTDDRFTRIVFLDCGSKLDSFKIFLWTSIAVGLLGCLIVFIVFLFAAGRIIRPIAESYEKQKRFITDAGHEIKTPLTIIEANLDLMEDDFKDNENYNDIRTQTKRLISLTGDLVYLSKMEESDSKVTKVEFPVSDLVTETAQQFRALAQTQNKEYRIQVEPAVTMSGVPDSIRQLTNILLDNAMKYSTDSGLVRLDMNVHKKMLVMSVYNTTAEPVSNDEVSRLFDRFYRTDASRNSESGGYGIGLSIARAIVLAHNGKITAETQSGSDFTVNVSMPLQ